MRRANRFRAAPQSPRRVRVQDGVLVLPPVAIRDLPPSGSIGTFMGIAALRFETPVGSAAVFLHDLGAEDVLAILESQRREAEAQLGQGYARRALWWEKQS
jgi:hypothetical protein